MNKTFIKGALYMRNDCEKIRILKFNCKSKSTGGARFDSIIGCDGLLKDEDGIALFWTPEVYDRAFHWSDLPTKKDREKAAQKCDPLNGKFEDEILRHYAAKRARLRNLTPVLGGEYYAKP